MSLLSSAQLTAIQKYGELGMTTTVTIHEMITNVGLNDDDPYGSKMTHETSGTTVKGWLVDRLQTDRGPRAGDVDTTTVYRLRLPVGTAIEPGWEVHILGNSYNVVDVGNDQTWPEWLNCVLKRSK